VAEELSLDLALDALLALMLPVIAWRVLATPDLRKAIVLFIALGLTAALAWARLAAPDIALVEAAVGTGVTGALLMSCLPWAGAPQPSSARLGSASSHHLALIPAAGVIGCLAWATFALPEPGPGLVDAVSAELARSGVSHPVTAVLLNYRGYDTLLEIVVLVAAAVGIDSVLAPGAEAALVSRRTRTLVGALARLLVPGFVVVAGYLVWKGSHAPGGAFQAGAVLAAGGVLLLFARRLRPLAFRSPAVRALVLSGLIVFVAVALAPVLAGMRMLEYPLDWAGTLILAIECALVVTIGLVLVMFFPSAVMATSARPQREAP
jgi:multisubunit Na+/H+ antiporter MnhB subunit